MLGFSPSVSFGFLKDGTRSRHGLAPLMAAAQALKVHPGKLEGDYR